MKYAARVATKENLGMKFYSATGATLPCIKSVTALHKYRKDLGTAGMFEYSLVLAIEYSIVNMPVPPIEHY